jgi:hypothetical protein
LYTPVPLTSGSQTKIKHFFSVESGGQSSRKRKAGNNDNFTKSDIEYCNRKLTDWIVNHAQPFSVVEQADFREFCSSLREEYPMPTRNTIKHRILQRWQDEKNRVRSRLKAELCRRRCGITTDMWTSAAKKGYMVVTVHYINSDWDMKHVILAFIRVLYPHTGERLAEHLLTAVRGMDPLLLQSVWAITADNASSNASMVNHINLTLPVLIDQCLEDAIADEAANDSRSFEFSPSSANEVFQLPCMAHTLQLAVKEGLKHCKQMDVAIGNFRDLVKKITDSPKLLESLLAISSNLKTVCKVPFLMWKQGGTALGRC